MVRSTILIHASGRIIYYFVGPEETVYFIMAYRKGVKDTLTDAEVNQLRKHRDAILGKE